MSSAAAALLALTLAAGPYAEARRSLAGGDLRGWARARAEYMAKGGSVRLGRWGILEDLARLVRCREPDRLEASVETPEDRALRRLLRLEAERLRRYLFDGMHAGSTSAALFQAGERAAPIEAEAGQIRWPRESERWRGERLDPIPEPTRCVRPTEEEDGGSDARAASERAAFDAVVSDLEQLPPFMAARVAHAYAVEGTDPEVLHRILEVVDPARSEHDALAAWHAARSLVSQGEHPDATWARLAASAKLRPVRQDARLRWAAALARAEPRDDDALEAALAQLIEPDEAMIAWRDHLRVRMAVEAGRAEEVDRVARQIGARRPQPLDARTWAWIYPFLLERAPEAALAAAASFGRSVPREVRSRWVRLGREALAAEHWSFAAAVFDQLLLEARDAGVVDEAEDLPALLADRARVALARAEGGALASLVDRLMSLEASPTRIRRALYALVQDAVAVLPPRDPRSRAPVAGRLLAALRQIVEAGGRLDPRLDEAQITLAEWAGELAEGRRPQNPSRQRPRIPPRRLGEVRLRPERPLPPAPEVPVPSRAVEGFLVFVQPEGGYRFGLPPRFALGVQPAP